MNLCDLFYKLDSQNNRTFFKNSFQVMGWGEKAIEIRSVSQGLLDGVFMHKRANKLKFLCERNDKVFFASVQSPSNSQVYFMSLPQRAPSY